MNARDILRLTLPPSDARWIDSMTMARCEDIVALMTPPEPIEAGEYQNWR